MTDYLTVIKRDPIKRGVREVIDVVPAQFLRQEPCHARNPANLGELGRVAKGVWEPEGAASLAKSALKVALAVEELPDQRFSAR